MGFAAGLAAGQRAAQGAIDAFAEARKSRNTRRANDEIQGLMAQMDENDFRVASQFVGPVIPEQGLGPPSTMGSEREALRADVYRKYGLMDEYDRALARSNVLFGQERGLKQDAEMARRYNMDRQRQLARDAATDKQRGVENKLAADTLEENKRSNLAREANTAALTSSINAYRAEQTEAARLANIQTQFGIDDVESYRRLEGAYSDWMTKNPDASPMEFAQSPEFRTAPLKVQEAVASQAFGTTAAQNAWGVQSMKSQLDRAGTLQDKIGVYSRDKILTPDVDYRVDPGEKDGEYQLIAIEDGKEHKQWSGSEEQITQWLYKQVESGATGAAYISGLRTMASEVAREIYELETDRGAMTAKAYRDKVSSLAELLKVMEDAAIDSDSPAWEMYNQMGADSEDPLAGMAAKTQMLQYMIAGAVPDRESAPSAQQTGLGGASAKQPGSSEEPTAVDPQRRIRQLETRLVAAERGDRPAGDPLHMTTSEKAAALKEIRELRAQLTGLK